MELEVLNDAMSQEKYKLHVIKKQMYIWYVYIILDIDISKMSVFTPLSTAISEWNTQKT